MTWGFQDGEFNIKEAKILTTFVNFLYATLFKYITSAALSNPRCILRVVPPKKFNFSNPGYSIESNRAIYMDSLLHFILKQAHNKFVISKTFYTKVM
jgi:hypothetical protein